MDTTECSCRGKWPKDYTVLGRKLIHGPSRCVMFELAPGVSAAFESCSSPNVKRTFIHFRLTLDKRPHEGVVWSYSCTDNYKSWSKMQDYHCCCDCYIRTDNTAGYPYCEDCNCYVNSRPQVGAAPMYHLRGNYTAHVRYLSRFLCDKLAPQHVYDIARHSTQFWRRRQHKYAGVLNRSTLAELSWIITQYV
jgi:hypothetical protein